MAELSRSLKRRAKNALGLSSVGDALTGAVAAVQRVDSAVRLNVHFHIIQIDGVYLRQDAATDHGPLSFYPLPTPSRAETTRVASRIAARVEVILKKHGRSLDPDEADSDPTEPELDHPALAACYSAAALGVDVGGERAGQPTLRLVHGDGSQGSADAPLDDEPVAEVRGINLYGKQWIDGRDRKQMERLFRYITRPPVAQERLSLRPDGTLLLEFTRAFGASARRGSPTVYLRGLRPACWTPSTPVQEGLEGRHPRSGAFARRLVGAPLCGNRAATLSHAALFWRAQ